MSSPINNSDTGVITRWSHQLGLATSKLFGHLPSEDSGAHFAMLDGRRASFACSVLGAHSISAADSRNWQWSADLAHHVLVNQTEVSVRSGADSKTRRFDRISVEQRLEEFLTFLDKSRYGTLPDIVPFLVDEFLQLWSVIPGDRPPGHAALGIFLLALQAAGETDPSTIEDATWRQQHGRALGLDDISFEYLDHLSPDTIGRAIGMQSRAPLGLKLVPSLVLRHAAGRLFQEAHAYLEAAQYGLWGNATVSTVPTVSPSGAYFTPVPIARLIAESALQTWTSLPDSLSIADFACGSAVFLCEALRALERRGYQGTVRLIGRDMSPAAVTMAKVAIAATMHELDEMRVEIDIEQADMLEVREWPATDVVLMNPPFRSWENMSSQEREWVQGVMGGIHRGRPDLSVGFVEHALRSLHPGGVLATLLPAGVLGSEGLAKWREGLSTRSTPKLIAVLGEHGLFRHALVNVGILILSNDSAPTQKDHLKRQINIAWASPDAGAASEAIRVLRRLVYLPTETREEVASSSSWSVTRTSLGAWNQRASWLPNPGALGSLLESLQAAVTTKVEDLFHVRQGIRTGAKDVFMVTRDEVTSLPKEERDYFKPAVDTASFIEGEIRPRTYLFVADPTWQSEDDVRRDVPEFFRLRLKPSEDILKQRKGIAPNLWWQLTRARGWAFEGSPRLVSKRFGLYPAFARDMEGQLAIVQANAWVPTKKLAKSSSTDLSGILTEYWWLLNSRVMVMLLREYCPNVAGGQLDLERKYVRHVPLPNLAERVHEDPGLQSQAMRIRAAYPAELPPISERDNFAAAAFGTNVADWPIVIKS